MPKWKDLNNEERWIGAVYGLLLALNLWGFWGAWWAVCLVPACVYLWPAGGAKKEDGGNKLYRRAGCSVIPGVIFFAATIWNVWALPAVPLAWWILSWGYGIPTYAPGRPDDDEGSLLGRLAYALVDKLADHPVPVETLQVRATAVVRTVIYLCLGLAWSPIWILRIL